MGHLEYESVKCLFKMLEIKLLKRHRLEISTFNNTLYSCMYDSYLLKDVHSVLVNFPREYAQESMMLYI